MVESMTILIVLKRSGNPAKSITDVDIIDGGVYNQVASKKVY
jgi:hypothetical protein